MSKLSRDIISFHRDSPIYPDWEDPFMDAVASGCYPLDDDPGFTREQVVDEAGGEYVNLERADDPTYQPRLVWQDMVDTARKEPR